MDEGTIIIIVIWFGTLVLGGALMVIPSIIDSENAGEVWCAFREFCPKIRRAIARATTPALLMMLVIGAAIDDIPSLALNAATAVKAKGIDIIAIGTSDANLAFLRLIASREDFAHYTSPEKLKNTIAESAKLLLAAPK